MAMSPEKKFEKDLGAVRKDIAALTGSIGRLASDTKGLKASVGKTAKGVVENAVEAGEEVLADGRQAATDAMHTGVNSLATQIKRNPMAAALAALGVGFFVGIVGRK